MPVTDLPSAPPARFCDIVMKGGITSGVVYPLAVVEIAKAFRFRNVGGTSAGAIAAAATAAAELGRDRGGFERLAELPHWLGATARGGKRSNLFALFQPQPGTRPLFEIAAGVLEARGPKAVALVLVSLRAGWPWALLGAALGLALLVGVGPNVHGLQAILTWAAGAVLAVAGAVAVLALWLWTTTARSLHANLYGLCTGRTAPGADAPALTDWLHGYLNTLAGRPADGPPLTFGDLWRLADASDPATATTAPGDAAIRLEMMTTSLSHGRPYRLPFRIDDNVRDATLFAFDPKELRTLFPDAVVDWMVARPNPVERIEPFTARGLVPLPRPEDFPVVVATRMSLSFPVLLSMVPLWAIDYGKPEAGRMPERCWFSDGGLCSNFPVHFFDSALPRWPTFAINLADVPAGREPGAHMPASNAAGLQETWIRFDGTRPKASVLGFLRAMQVTMQGWNDMVLTRMPGQRDRMATVTLRADEGGLNLNMPPARITALAERGREAGRLFVERFADPDPTQRMGWANQRWIRLRSLLDAHEEMLERILVACSRPEPGDVPYEAWLATDEMPSYPWTSRAQRDEAKARLHALVEEARRIRAGAPSLAPGAPEPGPELRVRPRL